MGDNLKIALVHDFLNQYGGAERVLEVFCEMFPQAPIYAIIYDQKKMRGKFANREIHTSFFQKLPRFLRRRIRYFLPFLPVAPETFDLRDFDLVISSSGAWSKGIVTRLSTIHIAYIHSPMRFVWDYNERYLREENKSWLSFLIRPVLSYLRIWDKLASDRPDYLVANSRYTQARIEKYYRRESTVIYPPVKKMLRHSDSALAEEGSQNLKSEILPACRQAGVPLSGTQDDAVSQRYFLVVSRLSPYKKIDKVIEAFNKLELPLVIVGEGKQEKYLKSLAGENIKFLGWQSDEELVKIYRDTRAFIFAGVDDFGMTTVEAMSFGVPVLAFKKGGVKEIVIEGKTGEFFEADSPEVIADGVRRLTENEKNYDREFIMNRAKEFSKERFVKEFRKFLGPQTGIFQKF